MTTDPGQAHSATPPVTPPVGPPVPAPPRHFPPTAQGSGPASRGPQRRFTRWIVGGVVLVAVAAAGVASGWALRGATSTQTPTTPSASRAPSGAGFDIAQAKTQACNGYATAGTQWARAYKEWLRTLSPGWRWNDPAVVDSTARFDTVANQAVLQMNGLIDPSTPSDVAQAIHGYTAAILAYAARHGRAPQDQMNAAYRPAVYRNSCSGSASSAAVLAAERRR